MLNDNAIWVAQGTTSCNLLLSQANRHGVIAGASGTGKTVTLKVLAEGFSQAGVPVFLADVKGDVTGLADAGVLTDFIGSRAVGSFGIDPDTIEFKGCPVRIWDMLGGRGIPVRVTVSDMGPTLIARLLGLTAVQEGVLDVAFRVADDRRLLLIDLKDLRSMLGYVSEHAKEVQASYGNVSSQSVGAIQRALLSLEDQGGNVFFGEPAFELEDFLSTAPGGQGYVNILDAKKLVSSPQVYSMFLLWMLSSLFNILPEVGDLDRPRLVFFFDEAHMLFADMPKELRQKIVQVVKSIRSKGVGVYFVSQSITDIPDDVLAQLSNRIQHGLRAYTPAEQRMLKATAASFRVAEGFDTIEALQDLGTGEALMSLLDGEGRPSQAQRAKVLFPQCSLGCASDAALDRVEVEQASLQMKYGTAIDRDSAYEELQREHAASEEKRKLEEERRKLEAERAAFEKEQAKAQQKAEREAERKSAQHQRMANSILGSIGREASRQVVRGIFNTLLK